MKYGELNLGQVEAIVNKLGGMEGVKCFLSGETAVATKDNVFRVQSNYDLSVKEAIKAGNYDWKNDDIDEKNFPSKRSGQAEIKVQLICFNKNMSSEDVRKELDQMGLRPAELPELLALGAKYPDEQRKYPIVALGSVWQGWYGDRYVACLWGGGVRRCLSLCWFDDRWHESYRIAAVSK